MAQSIVQVDAFTQKPFAGNPAAVCILEDARPEAWMRNVAREMNLAETAFLVPVEDGFNLRWFTPTVEVDLCGHATLASAHVLWEAGRIATEEPVRFQTRSGELAAMRRNGRIELDFPAEPATPCEPDPQLLDSLGCVSPMFVGQNRMDHLVHIESADALRSLKLDMSRLAKVTNRGVIVTAKSDRPDCDFFSRFFAPAAGVDEDAVTGSAHCCLGPFWADRLGRDELTGYQASARGGTVYVKVAGDRVILGGYAITVMRAQLVE